MAVPLPTSLDVCEEDAREEISDLLGQSPRQKGISRSRWRLKDIRDAIAWLRDKTLAGVSQILDRLDFSWQRTTSFVKSPDPAYETKLAWYRQVRAAAEQHPEDIVLLYQDEFSYYLHPQSTYRYGQTGDQTPKHYHTDEQNELTRVGGVLNHRTGEVLYLQQDKFGKQAMSDLYQDIRERYPERTIYVVQDNCPFHKNDDVWETIRELNIIPVFLPTYASWMNPIEKLWRWARADVLNGHRLAHSLQALRETVAGFLNRFSEPSPNLLHYVGLSPD